MTLKSTIENIKTLAAQIPNMGFVGVGDIYKLNAQQNIQYPAFIITQQEHMYDVQDDYTNINLVFFYVDRLLEDKSNELDIQSFGLTTIKELINDLNAIDINIIENYRLDCFTERFESDCAGALAYVTLHIPTEDCEWESIFDYLYHLFEERINNKQDKLSEGNYIKINNNTVSVTGITELIDETEREIVVIQKDIRDIKSDIEDIEKTYVDKKTFKEYSATTAERIKHIEESGYDDTEVRELISENTSDINALKGSVTALDKSLEELSSKVDKNVLESDFEAYTANTKTVLDNKADKSDLEAVSEGLTALGDKVSTIDEKVAEMEQKDYLTKNVADNLYQPIGDYAFRNEIPRDYVSNDRYNTYTAETAQKIAEIEEKGYDDTEVRNLIKNNKDAIDNLEATKQPKGDYALKSEIPSLDGYATEQWVEDKGYSTFSGSYNDLSDKPTIPEPYDDTAIKQRITKIEETLQGVDEFLHSL